MDVSSVVMTIVSITIGVLLIGSLMLPQITSLMSKLSGEESAENPLGGHDDWASMLGVLVICTIIGLIAVALYAFKSKN